MATVGTEKLHDVETEAEICFFAVGTLKGTMGFLLG